MTETVSFYANARSCALNRPRVSLNSEQSDGLLELYENRARELIRLDGQAANVFYSIKRDTYRYTNLLQNAAKLFDRYGSTAVIDIPIIFFMPREYVREN